jgi:hypothetical protein
MVDDSGILPQSPLPNAGTSVFHLMFNWQSKIKQLIKNQESKK